MRNFISMLMILALVVTTTTLPSESHAMPHSGAKATQTQVATGHDCHKSEPKVAFEKTAQNESGKSDKCCDKGICKCVGGTCHNGISKIFGNGGDSLFSLTESKGQFTFVNELLDSALPARLKRPPKA